MTSSPLFLTPSVQNMLNFSVSEFELGADKTFSSHDRVAVLELHALRNNII